MHPLVGLTGAHNNVQTVSSFRSTGWCTRRGWSDCDPDVELMGLGSQDLDEEFTGYRILQLRI